MAQESVLGRFTIAHVASAAAEACWLGLLVLLPAAFNPEGALAVEPLKASLLRSVAALIAAFWATARLADSNPTRLLPARPLWLASLGVLAACGLSTVLSVQPAVSFFGSFDREMGFLTVAAGVALLLTGADLLADAARRERAITALLAGAVLPCAYAFAQILGLDPLRWIGVAGVVSTFGSPTFLSGYLVLLMPFALYRVVVGARGVTSAATWRVSLSYVASVVLAVLAAILVVVLGIRAALVGLVVEAVLFALLVARTVVPSVPLRWVLAAMALPVGATALLAAFSTGGDLPAVSRFRDVLNPLGSASERVGLWTGTVELLIGNPWRLLVGYGQEMQVAAFEHSSRVQLLSPNDQFDRAHNVLLDTWLTGGLVEVLSLAVLLVIAVRIGWQAYRERSKAESALAAAGLAALIGHLAEQTFAFQTVVTSTVFWVILAVLASLAPSRVVSTPRGGQRRAWWTALALATAVMLVPVLSAPAVADALEGDAQRALDRGARVQSAHLAELGAAWVPWAEELHRAAGIAWQDEGLRRPPGQGDRELTQAEAQLLEAAERAPLDPFAQARLVRHEVAWAERLPPGGARESVLERALWACARGQAAGPYRAVVRDTCAEAEAAWRRLSTAAS